MPTKGKSFKGRLKGEVLKGKPQGKSQGKSPGKPSREIPRGSTQGKSPREVPRELPIGLFMNPSLSRLTLKPNNTFLSGLSLYHISLHNINGTKPYRRNASVIKYVKAWEVAACSGMMLRYSFLY